MRTSYRTVRASVLARGAGDHDVHTAFWEATGEAAATDLDGLAAVVCVHGLGGSHLNWEPLGPLLARHGPVYAPDLAGFGLTPPAGRGSTLPDSLDLLAGFVDTVSRDARPGPVMLVGNSMGGLLALQLAARHPELVGGLVLVGASLPAPAVARDRTVVREFAGFVLPVLGTRALARRRRVSPERQVRGTLELCGVDPDRLPEGVLDSATALAAARRDLPWADGAFLQAARSTVRQLTLGRRELERDIDAVTAPTLVLHGEADRIVPVAASRRLCQRRPDFTLKVYSGLGHCPMLTDPTRLAADINRWRTTTTPAPAPS